MAPAWSGEARVFGEDCGAGVEEIDDRHGGEHVGFVVKDGVEGISYCPSGGKRRACAFPLPAVVLGVYRQDGGAGRKRGVA